MKMIGLLSVVYKEKHRNAFGCAPSNFRDAQRWNFENPRPVFLQHDRAQSEVVAKLARIKRSVIAPIQVTRLRNEKNVDPLARRSSCIHPGV